VQNRYGLEASAADHTLLDLCGTAGIAFVPFFAIAGPAAPGTGDPVHLTENIDAAALRLSPQEISSLAATPLPSYPHPGDPPN